MLVSVEIKDQDLADNICAGIEGGINYWCRSYRHVATPEQEQAARAATDDKESRYWQYLLPMHGGSLVFTDDEGGKHVLDGAALARGVALIAEKFAHHMPGIVDAGLGDASTGDVLIQCSVLGDIVYG